MKKSNGKQSMTVYCERCGYEVEYSKPPPRQCPKCGLPRPYFEKDRAWNPLADMWARAMGYAPSRRSSLTQWFFRADKLKEWQKFKAGIQDHEAIGPPPISGNSSQVVSFWWDSTGLKPLLMKAIQALLGDLVMGSGEAGAEEFLRRDPKVTALMSDYLNYWRRKGIIN